MGKKPEAPRPQVKYAVLPHNPDGPSNPTITISDTLQSAENRATLFVGGGGSHDFATIYRLTPVAVVRRGAPVIDSLESVPDHTPPVLALSSDSSAKQSRPHAKKPAAKKTPTGKASTKKPAAKKTPKKGTRK
jgi:hypothetical protein